MTLTVREKGKVEKLYKSVSRRISLGDLDDIYDLDYYLEGLEAMKRGEKGYDENLIVEVEFLLA